MGNFKTKRKEAEICQVKLAELLKVTQQMISYWETGKQELPIKPAKEIAKIFGCTWKELYED